MEKSRLLKWKHIFSAALVVTFVGVYTGTFFYQDNNTFTRYIVG